MHPHHPQSHQKPYYPPLQSRGFNPPAQNAWPPPQAPYHQAAQPQTSSRVQQYQNHPQYQQQQRPAQYYQQPQQFTPPQQRYAPQPHTSPHPPHIHSQGYYPPAPAQVHPPYAPSASYPQSPVVPPVRANSRSPEKRPLPAPAPSVGARQSPGAISPAQAGGYVTPPRSQGAPYASQSTPYTPANPPASSFSGRPTSQSFSRGQSFQAQAYVQPQPPHSQPQSQPQPQPQPQPQTHPTPPTHTHPQLPKSPVNGTPPTVPARTPDSPSKRPLPAPPGGAVSSPPGTPSRAGAPGVTDAASPPQRRTLPFSPTKPPSAEEGRTIGRSPIRPPQRSSTLPSPMAPQEYTNNGVPASVSRDDAGQASVPRGGLANISSPMHTGSSTPPNNTAFAPPPGAQLPSSAAFALPPRQKPTQSLAFRLASLSLQEEQSQKRPANHSPPQAPAPSLGKPSSSRSPARTVIDLDDAPPASSIRRPSFESKSASNAPPRPQLQSSVPSINLPRDDSDGDRSSGVSISVSEAPSINVSAPSINVSAAPSINISEAPTAVPKSPSINVSVAPAINVPETPTISISEAPSHDEAEGPSITFSEATPKITVSELPEVSTSSYSSAIPDIIVADLEGTLETSISTPAQKRKGLICYGCGNGIVGRIVSAMGGRWHPACFKCTVCSELLEHVSSYEHAGRPYCHLDYHEKFAPQCYHCRTPIIDERFITLDDPALGKRMYHEQHFFCAECGDPFLAPTIPGKQKDTETSGVVAQDDDVGFTVYNGHPYCEACHVRLRYPKCKRCKKSIRDGMQAVEALGGKWCWECFLCAGCEKPFDDPAFFQRENKAYCEPCFSVIIKSEI